jgi:hypothetical protein
MDPKGHVWINREFVHTTMWPDKQVNFLTGETHDLEKEYKESLAGNLVTVMDVAVDDSGYLVLGKTKEGGHFLWMIEKGDTKGFIPVIKKNGILMPAGLSPIEEFKYMAEHYAGVQEEFNKENHE